MNIVAVDTETTGLSVWQGDKPFAISLCWPDYSQQYIEFPVDLQTREVKYDFCKLMKFCEPLFDPKIEKVFHHAKFDIRMLNRIGVNLQGKVHDTFLASRCCYTDEPSYRLKDLALKYLDIKKDDEAALKKQVQSYRGKAKRLKLKTCKASDGDYWLPKAMGAKDNLCKTYCLRDTYRTMALWQFYFDGMQQLEVFHSYEKELQLLPVVYGMEERGLRVDRDKLKSIYLECLETATLLHQELKTDLNITNVNSAIQIRESLYVQKKLPILKYTKKNNPSTQTETIKKLEKDETVQKLLKYRGYETGVRYSTQYMSHLVKDETLSMDDLPFLEQYSIHTSLNQFAAKTNRFASSDPNLQNVSEDKTSSGEFVVNLRRIFVPRNGYIWASFDYKQLELRIYADRAKEQKMLDAFSAGRDIHDETRQKVSVLACLPEKKGRKIAKNTNFLKIFCGGAKTLSEKYGVPYEEAIVLLNEYDIQFPRIPGYAKELTRKAYHAGYIINAYDRKLFVKQETAYRGVSYDIQGSAADLMKLALIKIDSFLKKHKLDAHLVLTVHDEIILEIKKNCFSTDLLKEIKKLMEDHNGAFDIDLPVDCAIIMDNWASKAEIQL